MRRLTFRPPTMAFRTTRTLMAAQDLYARGKAAW
jgi:hypothetical protein